MFGFLFFAVLLLLVFLFVTQNRTQQGSAWWVEITTERPKCLYYFGPFNSAKEAKQAQAGYIEDLEQEGSQGITVAVKWCQPQELTVDEEQLTYS
jgi:hypothetical protein